MTEEVLTRGQKAARTRAARKAQQEQGIGPTAGISATTLNGMLTSLQDAAECLNGYANLRSATVSLTHSEGGTFVATYDGIDWHLTF